MLDHLKRELERRKGIAEKARAALKRADDRELAVARAVAAGDVAALLLLGAYDEGPIGDIVRGVISDLRPRSPSREPRAKHLTGGG